MRWRAGFELMEWTFDPLEIKNAHLNIARLGAIARRYKPNFYGPSTSPLQGGLPTDRLYAEWWLRVASAYGGRLAEETERDGSENVDRAAGTGEAFGTRIYVRKGDRGAAKLAEACNPATGVALESAFARGLAVTGL